MTKEIRIYYESYEQANHYIKPIIQNSFPGLEIKLVCLSKGNGYVEGSLISRILKFKNPDIMISHVVEDEEIPLFVIEFSEAVTTEDHELQRFDGYLGAVAGKCFYIKISPLKESQSRHGGNVNFNIFEPYALIFKRFNSLSFHFEWPLETPVFVKRNPEYFSCPPPNIADFDYLIIETIRGVIDDYENIKKFGLFKIIPPKIKNKFLIEWIKKLEKFSLIDNCHSFKSSRLKWLKKEDVLLFKFNRMGHAMDPERGMIWYYRYRYNKTIISRIIFPSQGDKVFENNKLKSDFDYLKAFIDGTNIDRNGSFTTFLKKQGYFSAILVSKEINITKFIFNNFNLFNKQLFAIFSNSNKLLIQDKKEKNRIILWWDNIQDIFSGRSNIRATKIKERDFIEEDDITYIVAHQVLKKNGFKIISLSYPGAQGDRAILPQAGTGREQSRKYIDIVACYPKKYLDLTENKGSYKLPEVALDIEKLNFYRSNLSFKQALDNLVEKISPENMGLPILLSVSFWIPSEDTNLKGLPIEKINFFITISPDRGIWKVWIGGNLNIFKYREGKVSIEKTYYIE